MVRLALALALCALGSRIQAQEPSVELVSLMDLRFYDQNGGFMADGLCIVFPPESESKYTLAVRDAGGAVKATANLQLQKWGQYAVFDGLASLGVPVMNLGQPGNYVMSVDRDGKPMTSFAFEMKVSQSGDPFNPKKTFTREGPWRKSAFLTCPTGKPDQALVFHFWSHLGEIPKQGSKFPQATAKLYRGDEEIAAFKNKLTIAGETWRHYKRELFLPDRYVLSQEKLQSMDGDYRIVVESDGKAIKAFPLKVAGGKIQPHARTSFDTQPHTDYIVPKWIDRSSGSEGSYIQNDLFWLEAK